MRRERTDIAAGEERMELRKEWMTGWSAGEEGKEQ